jgi:predicted nucleotidyltransferase
MGERYLMLERVCRHFEVAILYAFGSQAKRVQDWLSEREESLALTSDVDIGVKTAKGLRLSIAEKISLTMALENIFGCQRVDLVFLAEADPFLAAQILRGERLFVLDEYEADEYELYILRRAGDLAPLERERIALVLGGNE